jgi:PmbA protein
MQECLEQVLGRVRDAGAEGDAVLVEGLSTTVQVRLGEVDLVKQSRERGLGLRVFVGERSAVASSSDLDPVSLEGLVEATLGRARSTAAVEHAGLPDMSSMGSVGAALELGDGGRDAPTVDEAIRMVQVAEEAALAVDPRLKQSSGAKIDWGTSARTYGTTSGFMGSYTGSFYALGVTPVAEVDGQLTRDSWSSVRRHVADLASPEEVGRVAGERTVSRVGAEIPGTCRVPVVFDPRTSGRLATALANALNGYAVQRGQSFLRDRVGERVAAPGFHLYDDPCLPRGLGSRPFDGEGLPSRRNALIEDGVVQGYLLDTFIGRKLGQPSTHSASRGIAGAPTVATTNLCIEPGDASPEEIIGSVRDGLYVTDLFGFGVNPTTGDISQGAAGLWIQDGKLAHPVHEITIAGHLITLFESLEVIGNDPHLESPLRTPTLKFQEMTVGGSGG